MLSNIFFIHGFVPSANNCVVPGGWSIGTEMAFYAIFPAVYYCINFNKRFKSRSFFAVLLAIVCNVIFQFMLITFTNLKIENNNFYYFQIVNQLPVFLFGFVYYFIFWKTEQRINSVVQLLIQIIGFFIFSILALLMLFLVKSPFAYVFLPVFSGVSFIFLIDFLRTKKMSFKILQNVGKVSYSMYIFHFLFVSHLVPLLFSYIFLDINPIVKFFLSFLLSILFSFIFARISEKIIEENGIAIGSKIISKFLSR